MIPTRCSICEVYGYCTTTDNECQAYHEGFAWKDQEASNQCTECGNSSYCTTSDQECEGYHGALCGESDRVIAEGTRNMPANQGLVNWISGPIVSIEKGDCMVLVTIQLGNQLMTSMLSQEKFEELGHEKGDMITLAVKAYNAKILR
ncbi:MAG TPA: TOBE domain-containing protein [Syntrophomonadaceae bacterium]|nr:TOBE domain-containing protein [Syntrophomonadaceae bacterium]